MSPGLKYGRIIFVSLHRVGCRHKQKQRENVVGPGFCARYTHPIFIGCFCPFYFLFFLLALPCLLLLSMLLKIKWNLFCIIWLAKVLDTRKSYDTTLRNVEISHELHKNFIGFNLFSCKKTKKTGFFSLFYKGA